MFLTLEQVTKQADAFLCCLKLKHYQVPASLITEGLNFAATLSPPPSPVKCRKPLILFVFVLLNEKGKKIVSVRLTPAHTASRSCVDKRMVTYMVGIYTCMVA
jgi:hypothetical protein